MTLSVFDLTDHCQLAIRYNTGAFPGKYAVTIYIGHTQDTPSFHKELESGKDPVPDF